MDGRFLRAQILAGYNGGTPYVASKQGDVMQVDIHPSVAEIPMEDVKRAAEIMNVSRTALYRKIREGKIPAFRFGRKVLLDMEEVKKAMRIKT